MTLPSPLPPEMLETLFDAFYMVDRRRRITFWSAAAERISGFSSDDVVGSRCADGVLMHIDEDGNSLCHGLCPLAASMGDGQQREAKVFLHHKEGHRVPVRVRTVPLRGASGDVVGGLEVFTDELPREDVARRLEELERLAMLDQLTELPNRRFVQDALEARRQELQRYGWGYGVLMLDIDHFKRFNDTWGHDVGDEVLKVVATTIAGAGRVFDVVGRWGGEEFLAVIARVDHDALLQVGERFRALVEGSRVPHGEERLQVTVSIGAALATPEESTESVVKRADEQLYVAKEGGRNRVCG